MLKFEMANRLLQALDRAVTNDECLAETLVKAAGHFKFEEMEAYLTEQPQSPRVVYLMMVKAQQVIESEKKTRASEIGKKGADAVHGQPGGSRDKQSELRDIWKTGKYKTKIKCASDEHEHLGMSLETARKALREKK